MDLYLAFLSKQVAHEKACNRMEASSNLDSTLYQGSLGSTAVIHSFDPNQHRGILIEPTSAWKSKQYWHYHLIIVLQSGK